MMQTRRFFFYLTLFLSLVIVGQSVQAAQSKSFDRSIPGLDPKVVNMAVKAYNTAASKGQVKRPVVTIIDYSKPSTHKRMWVLDLNKQKVLYNTHVSHGKNSGGLKSTRFSNRSGSHASSLGVFVTAETYQGRNGYSLRLDGLEKGVNDRARRRAVVMHGADYATSSFAQRNGYLGRSQGCPAIPRNLSRPVINSIKNGSLIFAYYPNHKWIRDSKYT